MKIALLVLLTLAVLVALMAIIGALLPRAHTASRSASYRQTPALIYAVIPDFAAAPTWRGELKAVELLRPREGHACFRETTRHGVITYVVIEDRAGERFVTEIADHNL